jgi:hypothetical protein
MHLRPCGKPKPAAYEKLWSVHCTEAGIEGLIGEKRYAFGVSVGKSEVKIQVGEINVNKWIILI